jgi:anti-sigma regulatory factor (Ser/Thr protein kinase)
MGNADRMERWQVEPLDFLAVHRCRGRFAAWLASRVSAGNPLFEYELVFGELLTNAVRHGSRPVHVEVDIRSEQIRISVEDFGECFDLSDRRSSTTYAQSGRGLDIVKQLAAHLSVSDGPNAPCRVEARMTLLA